MQRDARLRHALPDALVLAAADYAEARSAGGLLAAAIQQRLIRPNELRTALIQARQARHRGVLLATLNVEQGAEALSELDFAHLCRRFHLPSPLRQAVRIDPSGRRRYLDAEWLRRDGVRVVAEIDGAIHLKPDVWVSDQLRQNELALDGSLILRFPSIILRTDPAHVASQLRRALLAPNFAAYMDL